ncbi:connectin-like [Spodoptera litura]|uniref:Connectin-like n=1 Tax=Spodoptera litura TaxID=69820 RepID=A0A9J7E9P5_SPOLT|nr:connectin-like [Spodoptera litura]XP_022826931.1 connectin-like [Spodoptera litura]
MAFWRILTVAFATSMFAEAKSYHYQKRETSANICDPIYNNTNAVQCYCVQTGNLIRSASCHMVKKDVPTDDKTWDNFEILKEITKLTISNTRGIAIPYIPTNALKHTNKLLKVDVKYGNIERIDAFAFANLSLIEEIMLSDNQIKILKKHAFAHHRDLTVLGLDSNNIIEINRDVFIELPSLETLYLTNNKITTIHDKAFVHLINLKELEIDRNGLFSLNSETFSGLRNLQKLDLSSNNLEVIGDNTFLPLVNLRTLNLEENKIQMLDEKAFNGLARLNILNLAHNKLTTIENVKTFEGLESLTMLNLKSNLLNELKPQVMSPILKNFYGNTSSLDVEDNNFPCDCRLDWFISLMNKTQNIHFKRAIENLKCNPDNNLRELWAKTEELEKNTGQVLAEEEESQVQNTDYEYYDETQLNGKLFYIDVRDLANCTNTSRRVLNAAVAGKKPATTSEADAKLSTKAKASPVTTPMSTTEYEMSSSVTTPEDTEDVVETKKSKEDGILKPNKENETKNKESFTTVRLVTVSAKPLEHNYDHDMASDEARPEKVKEHTRKSIQDDIQSSPKRADSSASSNVNSVALVTMILCFRLYFY